MADEPGGSDRRKQTPEGSCCEEDEGGEAVTDMIRTSGLVKRYGKVVALDGLDLEVPKGTVLGLLGPNGAGKTTAVRILTTLLDPDGGSVEVAGLDVCAEPVKVRKRIGLSGQTAAVDEHLTGYENLEMVGRLYHLGKRPSQERARELLEQFDLVEAGDRPAKTYSGGMRRRLDVAAPPSSLRPNTWRRPSDWRTTSSSSIGGTRSLMEPPTS